MKFGTVARTLVLAIVIFVTPRLLPAEPSATIPSLNMSPDLQQLFQAEMRELLLGTQHIAGALPVANWDGIADSALAMRNSYVLEQKLTTAQRQDLEQLPEQFKAFDEAFHHRAEKLRTRPRPRMPRPSRFTSPGCWIPASPVIRLMPKRSFRTFDPREEPNTVTRTQTKAHDAPSVPVSSHRVSILPREWYSVACAVQS